MTFLFPWLLFPYVLAALMPSGRWLAGCVLVVGGFLAVIWGQHWIASSAPVYKSGPGGALGDAFFVAATVGFVSGAAVRFLTLSMSGRGRAKAGFAVNVLGFALPVALLALPTAWDAWRLRPPSEACASATFDLDIAGSRFAIPAAPIFNIYPGRGSAHDAYYLGLTQSLRDFCSMTQNGQRRMRAAHLWIRFDEARLMRRTICVNANADWAGKLCAAIRAASSGDVEDDDFPIDANIYALDEVVPGKFLGSASTYDDSFAAATNSSRDTFVQTSQVTPDNKPLTYDCGAWSGGGYFCRTSYPWRDGAHINYAFRSGARDVEEKGLRVDAKLKEFLARLQSRAAS
jgi:hypothetical protein